MRVAAVLGLAVMLWLPGVAHAASRYAAIVVDYESGEVLHSRSADVKLYPASMTKMMTLYMLFDALEAGKVGLSTPLKVSRRAAGMAPSKLGLAPGSKISAEDAIKALVTKSANDVAVVIAESLGGSETRFAAMMTKRAHALGMSRTTFKNASGLPNRGQRSTARDMATLASSLIRDHADYYKYFSLASFRHAGRDHRNHNRLLARYDGMDGLKTGYIRASGFNLAASAMRDGRRLVTVVFGGRTSRSRDAEVARLMDLGFDMLRQRGPLVALGPPASKPDLDTAVDIAAAGDDALLDEDAGAADEVEIADGTDVADDNTDAEDLADVASSIAAADIDVLPVVHAPQPLAEDALVPSAKPGLRLESGASKQRPQGQYGVQVGAFHDAKLARRTAHRVIKKLPDILLKGNIDISALNRGRRPIYRARIVGFSQAQANEACRLLKRKKQDCMVLKTGPLQVAANN